MSRVTIFLSQINVCLPMCGVDHMWHVYLPKPTSIWWNLNASASTWYTCRNLVQVAPFTRGVGCAMLASGFVDYFVFADAYGASSLLWAARLLLSTYKCLHACMHACIHACMHTPIRNTYVYISPVEDVPVHASARTHTHSHPSSTPEKRSM